MNAPLLSASDIAELQDLAKLVDRAIRVDDEIETDTRNPDEQLQEDLQACVDARALIPTQQENLRALLDQAEGNIERDARQYQIELVAAQIERAATIAEERLKHLAAIKTSADIQEELDRCIGEVESTLYWFKYYAWGYDPREDSPLKVVPLYPFNFQAKYIRWLEDLVFRRRSSGLAEKSRDMGATSFALAWATKQWRFRPYFSTLLTSATEDLVDSKQDPDTLFEKVRFQLRRFPSWMLPSGFDLGRAMPYMNISNPDNRSTIQGAAPTSKVARQRRRSFILADEFPVWPAGGYEQYTSMSQSARSVLYLGTPKGMFNKYAELRHSSKVPVFVMDWRDHPWKGGKDRQDTRWYQALPYGIIGPAMTPEEVAQEVDRDYHASQPGRVFPWWDEVIHVITQSEFARVYGENCPPRTWNLGRAQDVGTTVEHLNVTSWATTPRQDAKYADLGLIFGYREFVAPTDWSCEEIGEGKWDDQGNLIAPGIWQMETIENTGGATRYENSRIVLSFISQEGESERRTYWKTCRRYPIRFSRIKKPEANAGIAQMRAAVHPRPEPNPFVLYPEGHPAAGQPIIGLPMFMIVVPDDEGKLVYDKAGDRLYRTGAKTARGQPEIRREMPLIHYPVSEKDKPVAVRKPFKRDDDAFDNWRYLWRAWGPAQADKPDEEFFEDQLPEALRSDTLTPKPGEVWDEAEQEKAAQRMMSREVYLATHQIKESRAPIHYRQRRRQRTTPSRTG